MLTGVTPPAVRFMVAVGSNNTCRRAVASLALQCSSLSLRSTTHLTPLLNSGSPCSPQYDTETSNIFPTRSSMLTMGFIVSSPDLPWVLTHVCVHLLVASQMGSKSRIASSPLFSMRMCKVLPLLHGTGLTGVCSHDHSAYKAQFAHKQSRCDA